MYHAKSMGNPCDTLGMQVKYEVEFCNGCDDYKEVKTNQLNQLWNLYFDRTLLNIYIYLILVALN